jgi:radical SAM superfamily enzyme YgiQ (UPF0313 family)
MKKAIVLSAPAALTSGGHETRLGKNTARAPGAHMVAQCMRDNGYDTINIEYINDWLAKPEFVSGLTLIMEKHFSGCTDGVIGLSLTIGHHAVLGDSRLVKIIEAVRKNYNVRVAAGGLYRPLPVKRKEFTAETQLPYLIDAYFIGRSLTMFPTWLNKGDMSEHYYETDHNNSIWYKLKNPDVIPEPPIVMALHDSDSFNPRDVLTIELGVGCKFNCSFCNTPFKKSATQFQSVDNLVEFLSEAHSRYGVKHFNLSDETTNEVDQKYENLLTAVRQLDYQPEFTGYARLDMLSAKRYQIEQMAEIGFKGVFFGIETLDNKAGKNIRKITGGAKNLESLRLLKENVPDLYRFGSFMIGLTYDSEEKIQAGFDYIVEHQLLHNTYINQVGIGAPYPGDTWASDFSKNPEKFGFTVTADGAETTHMHEWKNDWITSEESIVLKEKFRRETSTRLGFGNFMEYTNWEYLKDKALGGQSHPDTAKDQDPDRLYQLGMMHTENYIRSTILKHGG